jgi:ABC-2 type transport system ATP-binding protein
MSFFEARNIEKYYANRAALNNVSIHVPKSSIYGLLGPNGAGKTTLIRIINRITAPDSGNLLIDGKPLANSDISRIGYLPEERGLYKKMRVGEQALYLSQLKGLSKSEALKRLRYWFDKFDMATWWDRRIEELSKGMAQKVQFIIAILHDPEFIILDEPFSGFDPVNANMLKQEVLNLRNQGKTIILSTHDMSSVEELCDNISLLNKAETILEGNVKSIQQAYKSNTFELIFSGSHETLLQKTNGNYTIIESGQKADGTNFACIKLDSKLDGNEFLRKALDVGTIHSFKEILPSMNEVFIQAVEQSHKMAL